jgi:hypothetical protein
MSGDPTSMIGLCQEARALRTRFGGARVQILSDSLPDIKRRPGTALVHCQTTFKSFCAILSTLRALLSSK